MAGGGGGGMDMAGGGGVVYNAAFPLTSQSYTVTVGNGGSGAPAAGTNGQPASHQYTSLLLTVKIRRLLPPVRRFTVLHPQLLVKVVIR